MFIGSTDPTEFEKEVGWALRSTVNENMIALCEVSRNGLLFRCFLPADLDQLEGLSRLFEMYLVSC
jgi:hypothetical protein